MRLPERSRSFASAKAGRGANPPQAARDDVRKPLNVAPLLALWGSLFPPPRGVGKASQWAAITCASPPAEETEIAFIGVQFR